MSVLSLQKSKIATQHAMQINLCEQLYLPIKRTLTYSRWYPNTSLKSSNKNPTQKITYERNSPTRLAINGHNCIKIMKYNIPLQSIILHSLSSWYLIISYSVVLIPEPSDHFICLEYFSKLVLVSIDLL